MTETKWAKPAIVRSRKGRLLAVADLIERDPEHWDQRHWVNGDDTPATLRKNLDCNTACCIAGWTVAVTPPSLIITGDFMSAAAHSLGLTNRAAVNLFGVGWLDWVGGATRAAKAAYVAQILRNLADNPKARTPDEFTLDDLYAAGLPR